jgi:D-beta-D-heptose 7-phosphate kinase / D-beta-D-heptose 1-phosphate adenosyltransferase
MRELKNYIDIIASFRQSKVLVIGDFMTDVYIKGISTRICPEAPVPVVDVSSRFVSLGGAANTACNVRMLGAEVTYCTVIGTESAGEEAFELLKQFANSCETILRVPGRETISKTRVIAGQQLITRFDSGTTTAADDSTTELIVRYLRREYQNFDAVILSDYEKGIFTPTLVNELAKLRKMYTIPLIVDSKRLPFFKCLSPSIVKPNYEEAIKMLDMPFCPQERTCKMRHVSDMLHEKTGAEVIALTMDLDGSFIFQNGREPYHARANSIAVPQVAGAGDAYIAAFALAYVNSRNMVTSANIATAAATVAIGKTATATCSAEELKCYFNRSTKYVGNLHDLETLCENYRVAGKKIVFTNGCFDILHSGHVALLEEAKALGDVLIVGLNNDESIRRLKGKSRPVNQFTDRLKVLSGLASLDLIVTFGSDEDDTPINLIRVIRPDVFVKGGDYIPENLPEFDVLTSMDASIVIIPSVPDRSTTNIIRRVRGTELQTVDND